MIPINTVKSSVVLNNAHSNQQTTTWWATRLSNDCIICHQNKTIVVRKHHKETITILSLHQTTKLIKVHQENYMKTKKTRWMRILIPVTNNSRISTSECLTRCSYRYQLRLHSRPQISSETKSCTFQLTIAIHKTRINLLITSAMVLILSAPTAPQSRIASVMLKRETTRITLTPLSRKKEW